MAAGDAKVPILETVRESMAFMRASAPVYWPAATALIALNTASILLLASADTAGAGTLLLGADFLMQVCYAAFLLRLAIRRDRAGLFGLQFGLDEARLMGVTLVTTMLGVLIVAVGFFAFSFLLASVVLKSGVDPSSLQNDPQAMDAFVKSVFSGPTRLPAIALVGFFVAIIAWASARLCLALPATIGERRFLMFSTFAWTRGNTLHILAVLALIVAPPAFAVTFVDAALGPQPSLTTGAVFLLVVGVVEYGLVVPMLMGAYAYLYRGLRPHDLARAVGPIEN